MRNLILFVIMLTCILSVGCVPPNLCENACGVNATCQVENERPVCTCKKGFYGIPQCLVQFDKSDFMVTQKVCPEDETTQVVIRGQEESKAQYNGYYIEVPKGTFSRCVLIAVARAYGVGIPVPSQPGKVVDGSGIEVLALDPDAPMKDDQNGIGFNSIPVPKGKSLRLFFRGHRAKVLFHNANQNRFEDISFQIKESGVVAITPHLSPFYLLNRPPQLKHKISCDEKGECTVDLEGTTDEGSSSLSGITVKARINGTMRTLTQIQGTKYRFQVNPKETHEVQLIVSDPYQAEAMSEVQTLQASSDPCSKLQCGQHGRCVMSGKQAICECDANYSVKGGVCTLTAPKFTKPPKMPLPPCENYPEILACPGITDYSLRFEYSGVVEKVTAKVSITGGSTPGTIRDLTFKDGKASFSYKSSWDGGADIETVEITLHGPLEKTVYRLRHGIF